MGARDKKRKKKTRKRKVADSKRMPKPLSPGQRMAIYERDRGVCFCCGVKCEFFTPGCFYGFIGKKPKANIDHILPRSRGGQNTDDNLATLCESCNKSKGAGL